MSSDGTSRDGYADNVGRMVLLLQSQNTTTAGGNGTSACATCSWSPPVEDEAGFRGILLFVMLGIFSKGMCFVLWCVNRDKQLARRARRDAKIAHERAKAEASKITIVAKDPSTGTTHEIASLGPLHTVAELRSAAAAELGTGTEAGQLRLAFKNEPLSSNSRTLGSCGMEEGSEVVALPAQLTPEEAVRASISLIPSRGPDSRP